MIKHLSHRRLCNYKNKIPESNEKLILKNLRCPSCNQICLIKLDKENFNLSFEKCFNCNSKKENEENNNNYNKLKNQINNNEYIKKTDFYCLKHHYNYNTFCETCNLNICEKCLSRHLNHKKIDLNSITPEQSIVFNSKKKIREIKSKTEKIIYNINIIKNIINKEINDIILSIENIFKIEEYIINNYNNKYPNTNYYYLQNFTTIINNLGIKIPILEELIENTNFESNSKALIDLINQLRKNNNDKEDKNISFDLSNINAINNNKSPFKNRLNKRNDLNCNNNAQYEIEKLNISLNDTFQKNEKLEGNKLITNEFVKLVKNIDEDKSKVKFNKDNNIIPEKNINDININSNDTSKNESSNVLYNSNDIYNSKNDEEEVEILTEITKEDIKDKFKIEVKFNKKQENIIKSIEFLNKKNVLICNPKSLNIFEIDDSYNLNLIKSIKADENNCMNYATKLKNGNIIICSTFNISIIKLEKINTKITGCIVIQKIIPKINCYNINKVIEIPNKSSIISCDKFYIIKYKTDILNKKYIQTNFVKIESEIKCIEYINNNVFAAVMPENNLIAFYDVDSINKNYFNIEKVYTIHGRYVIKNVEKFNCIFFASSLGLYLFSNNDNYKLLAIYKLDVWISALNYDFVNDRLICGGINKSDINNKNVNLIIFSVEKNESENNPKNKIKLLTKEKIDNICEEEITSINCSENNIIIGSKDKSIQLLNIINNQL